MGQQGTAVFRLQAELPAEQEIAAVKSDIVATLDHGHAVLRILAEHAAHDMHGRQDTGAAAMGESGPIAAIVPQVAVDQLAFEDGAREMTAIARSEEGRVGKERVSTCRSRCGAVP